MMAEILVDKSIDRTNSVDKPNYDFSFAECFTILCCFCEAE